MKKRERKKRKKNFFEKEIYAAIRYVEHEERQASQGHVRRRSDPGTYSEDNADPLPETKEFSEGDESLASLGIR